MDDRVITALQTALKTAGLEHLDFNPGTQPDLIPYGAFSLADNPDLCASLCNTVAEQTGCYWTLTAFKRLQNNSPENPLEPDPDSPEWWPAKDAPLPPALVTKHGHAKTRKLIAAYNLAQAKDAYETALKKYQELSLQIRALRAAADFGARGYAMAFIRALEMDFPAFVESFFLPQGRSM